MTCGCFPIQKNWQVMPDPGYRCTFKPQNFYVTTVCNVITDAAILCVPLPMIWMLRADWKRKVGLALLLLPGIFVITAALIRVVMSLKAHPSALNVNRWGVRETIAGIICVNLPILRPSKSSALRLTQQLRTDLSKCSSRPSGSQISTSTVARGSRLRRTAAGKIPQMTDRHTRCLAHRRTPHFPAKNRVSHGLQQQDRKSVV